MGNSITNEKSIYDHENNFPKINSCQFTHRTWGDVWVVIAISSFYISFDVFFLQGIFYSKGYTTPTAKQNNLAFQIFIRILSSTQKCTI